MNRKELNTIAPSLLLKGFFGWGGLGLVLSTPMSSEHVDGLLSTLAAVLGEPEA
jgi:hypothetical protein